MSQFSQIKRFDRLDFSSGEMNQDSNETLNDIVATAKSYLAKDNNIKVKIIGHASEGEESLENSKNYAQSVAQNLLENNISKEMLYVEYRGSKDIGFTAATCDGTKMSNRVMVSIYVSKPDAKDTDNDGVFDAKDECPGTMMGLKVDEVGCPISMTLQLGFAIDSAIIEESLHQKVLNFSEFLKDSPAYHVDITGHTDSTGSLAYNMDLSLRRAKAIQEALLKDGIDPSRLRVFGEGEAQPLQLNKTREGRAVNRRIEVKIFN